LNRHLLTPFLNPSYKSLIFRFAKISYAVFAFWPKLFITMKFMKNHEVFLKKFMDLQFFMVKIILVTAPLFWVYLIILVLFNNENLLKKSL